MYDIWLCDTLYRIDIGKYLYTARTEANKVNISLDKINNNLFFINLYYCRLVQSVEKNPISKPSNIHQVLNINFVIQLL